MQLPRLQRPPPRDSGQPAGADGPQIDAAELSGIFASPTWLRDLGAFAWFLIGVGVILAGLIVLLGLLATIVVPLAAASIIAAVAAPLVALLQRRRVPRAAGAALTLLLLLGICALIVLLVLAGIVDHGDEIKAAAAEALDKAAGWANDAGADNTAAVQDNVAQSVPAAGERLLEGTVGLIGDFSSVLFALSLALFSTFFLLKDGPSIRGWIDHHLGVPYPVARTVTSNVLSSLRQYFAGVSIVAAFNAIVVLIGAIALDVPLAGTIAVVTFVTAYVPYIGAFVSGAFAVVLALASQGTTTALIMLLIVLLANGLLQNVVQPIAFGATLGLNALVVLIVTIAGGTLFGMLGLILAAPLTSAGAHIARDLHAARVSEQREAQGEPAPAPPVRRTAPAPTPRTSPG
jgi:predicted PurR-regulated permease PerM